MHIFLILEIFSRFTVIIWQFSNYDYETNPYYHGTISEPIIIPYNWKNNSCSHNTQGNRQKLNPQYSVSVHYHISEIIAPTSFLNMISCNSLDLRYSCLRTYVKKAMSDFRAIVKLSRFISSWYTRRTFSILVLKIVS